MATRTAARAEPRDPLSRERVLRAAIELADGAGVEALTMRRLGQALGVEAMSLYNHVANKDDLLHGITELVFSEVAPPVPAADWKAAIRASAIAAHEILRRHPWAWSLMLSLPGVSSSRLRWMEGVLATLRQAGFSAEQACHAYHALDSHIAGFMLWASGFPPADELRELAGRFLQRLPADEYPYVVEHIHQHLKPRRDDDEGSFAFGLNLILDGLERLRDAG